MEKAVILIDGGYLNRVLKNHFHNSPIDYLKFSDEISRMLNLKRLRTYLYHCLPIVRRGDKEDERRHDGMQQFLTKLKRLPRFEIKLGKLQLIGGQFRQKMVDVLMSLDIVDMCFGKKVEHIVLIAGDADFIPAIKKAKDYGASTYLFYHPLSVHNELLDEIDELHVISEDFIKKCNKEAK